eukprot:jgi/Mesvir1/19919/Mv13190-RA.1
MASAPQDSLEKKTSSPAENATRASLPQSPGQIAKALIAGGLAGGISRSAVAPMERLKILFQVQDAVHPKYTGVWQGLRVMYRSEGIRGFFKGNGTNCARIVPNSAVKFLAYEHLTEAMLWALQHRIPPGSDEKAEMTPISRLVCGGAAGIVAMSSTYPLEMVRGRLSVQGDGSAAKYRGMVHAATSIIRQEGPLALYKGWLPSVIGVIPYVGLNFAVYESLKELILKQRAWYNDRPITMTGGYIGSGAGAGEGEAGLGVFTRLACGAVAGSIGQTVAFPLDVIRRRLQVTGWDGAARTVLAADGSAASAPVYTGMIDAFVKTVRHEGWRGLYKGLWTNYVKVGPSIAIAFVVYEEMKGPRQMGGVGPGGGPYQPIHGCGVPDVNDRLVTLVPLVTLVQWEVIPPFSAAVDTRGKSPLGLCRVRWFIFPVLAQINKAFIACSSNHAVAPEQAGPALRGDQMQADDAVACRPTNK